MKKNVGANFSTAIYKFFSRMFFIVIVCLFIGFVYRMIFGEGA